MKVLLDDFKDILPEELKKMLPTREVDHAIELIADAVLIAKPPYCHSLAQNVKLEN